MAWTRGPVVEDDLTDMTSYDGVRTFPRKKGGTITAGLRWQDRERKPEDYGGSLSRIGEDSFTGALHSLNGFTFPYPPKPDKFSVRMSQDRMRDIEWVVEPDPDGDATAVEPLEYEEYNAVCRYYDGIKCQKRTFPLVRPIISLCVDR